MDDGHPGGQGNDTGIWDNRHVNSSARSTKPNPE